MDKLQNTFEDILMSKVKRDGVESLIGWLRTTDFYTAPASTRFHGSFEGGLALHSLNVYHELVRLDAAFNAGLDPESMALAALCHDLCKIGYYKVSTRNVKNEATGVWEKKPFYKVEEDFPFGGHGSKSVFLLQYFVKLTPEEAAAINSHMGAWAKSDYANPSAVYEDNMLAWLLHVADEAATYVDKT